MTHQRERTQLIAVLGDPSPSTQQLKALVQRIPDAELHPALTLAHKVLAWIAKVGGFVRVLGDENYPPQLAGIPDPPPVLYGLGNPSAFTGMCVAVVGSRRCSDEGRLLAKELATDLSRAGICVVSGLARGVDGAAHRGALAAGGRTIAVLGAGLDRIYPPEHVALAREIGSAGAVISEFPPGTRPHKSNFPRRNRLISGLSAGVVLIEAGDKSGSLSTARHALDQGREVMVVPGAVRSARNRGGHQMIKQGAALVEHAIDVLEQLGLEVPAALVGAPPASIAVLRVPPEDPLGRALYEALADHEYTLNDLVDSTGCDVATVTAALVAMEVNGFVRLAGQSYSRAP